VLLAQAAFVVSDSIYKKLNFRLTTNVNKCRLHKHGGKMTLEKLKQQEQDLTSKISSLNNAQMARKIL